MARLASCSLALLVLAACGGDDALPAPDAGAADASSDMPVPGDVTPPALPTLTPCPSGWATVASPDGIDECEPPALAVLDAPSACPPGTALFAGSSACTPLGADCPAGPFPDQSTLPEASRVLYVRQGALGGDGSMVHPYGTIAAATIVSTPGTLIVVGKGDYDERVDLFRGVTLVGACAAETRIVPSASSTLPAVRMGEPEASVSRVTVAPVAPLVGVEVGADVRMTDTIVDGATGGAIYVRPGGGLGGSRIALIHTRVGEGRASAAALALDRDAAATVASLQIADCDGSAVAALSSGGVFVADDAAISDVGIADELPRALLAQNGATITLRASLLVRPRGSPGVALAAGALVRLEDSLVVGDRSAGAEATPDLGLISADGARIELERVRFAHVGAYASAALAGSTNTLTDVVVRDFGSEHIGLGVAFVGTTEAVVTLRRALVVDGRNAGLFASGVGGFGMPEGVGPALDVEDFTLVRANDDGADAGYGMALDTGAHGTVRRVSLTGVRGDAILAAHDGTDVAFEDLAILDSAEQGDGLYGRAIEIQYGAHVAVQRSRIERATEIAVLAIGEGSDLSMSDVAILGTRARSCAESGCSTAPGGIAVGVTSAARGALSGFLIDGAPLCGLQIAHDAELDVSDGVVRGAAVGACVEVAGYDIGRVTGSVSYENNDINVDTAERAVPEPATLDLSL